jgi:hypothetical protein
VKSLVSLLTATEILRSAQNDQDKGALQVVTLNAVKSLVSVS